MKPNCTVLLQTMLFCFGLQITFVHIRAVPVSNYGGYRPFSCYFEDRVIRQPRRSYSEWLTEQDSSSDKGQRGQMTFSRDYGMYMRDEIRVPSDSSIVFRKFNFVSNCIWLYLSNPFCD